MAFGKHRIFNFFNAKSLQLLIRIDLSGPSEYLIFSKKDANEIREIFIAKLSFVIKLIFPLKIKLALLY